MVDSPHLAEASKISCGLLHVSVLKVLNIEYAF
jgi:hypothetical protein